MNLQRRVTSTPGVRVSTTNAVMALFLLPATSLVDGVRAMTTKYLAMVPFVHQSFSPFSR